ncbi:hypothetical protein BH23GEM9_BH23GEM9_05510 [soil metagenome]
MTGRLGPAVIREIVTHEERSRCVAFQKGIWGEQFAEIVPAAILWVASRTGGIVAGAFDPDDTMVGFLFGLSGWVAGEPVHWSDMLAVLPAARGRSIGGQLKQYQRTILLNRGIPEVTWTFDPLESRNAYLNFAHLGVTTREYVSECYGPSSSPLHSGLGTDRLVARWVLGSDRVRQRMDEGLRPRVSADHRAAPVINDGLSPPRLDLDEPVLRLRIPADIQALKLRDAVAAAVWREHTRAAFESCFARGYEAVELIREDAEFSSYLLQLRDPGDLLR